MKNIMKRRRRQLIGLLDSALEVADRMEVHTRGEEWSCSTHCECTDIEHTLIRLREAARLVPKKPDAIVKGDS